jgi:homoaconitate hydratase
MLGTIYEKPSPRKNKSFGAFSAGNPLGFVFGTILAGVFTQVFDWRAGFFLLAIVYFVTTVVAWFTVPADTSVRRRLDDETVKRLDLPGTGMTILGIGLFCAALRYVWIDSDVEDWLMACSLASDAPQGWRTPYVLVLLVIGLILMAAFVVWEIKYPYAMIDMAVWKDRDFSLVSSASTQKNTSLTDKGQLFVIIGFGFIGFPVFSFWIALYFQTELNYSALMTGVHMLPMVVCGIAANIIAALIQHKVSNKLLVGIGAGAYLAAFILAAVQRYGDSYWAFTFPAFCLCVVGADFQFIVANVSINSLYRLSLTNYSRCTSSHQCR